MTEIKVLDKSVFNRIAAGEVVDRPSSIVKELVENAIDAGATAISVTVKGGGIESIRVSDNGKGIASAFVKTAFMAHATSKIKDISDLDQISTLGFRGEALPSIASVARVTMVTRTRDADLGTQYIIDNGVEVDFGEMGAPQGTSVLVENLFERIPARKKFLAKENTEENAISTLVSKFILANPTVSFHYTANGKNIYSSSGNGLESAINAVYGSDYMANMLKIDSTMSGIVLSGYINKPSFTKHSKSFQTLIINGRFVENDDVSYTVYGCYQKYLMKRQFPTYVLHLSIPYDMVDVNVHPNKMEVKFAIPGLIKKIVADTIRTQVLDAVSVPKDIREDFDEPKVKVFDFFEVKEQQSDLPFDVPSKPVERTIPAFLEDESEASPVEIKQYTSQEDYFEDKPKRKIDSSILGDIPTQKVFSRSSFNDSKVREPSYATITPSPFLSNKPVQDSIEVKITPKVLGKIFNTYIIVEYGNDICLIDQHAAHEKLLYDKLVDEYNNSSVAVQTMLIPYKFSVSAQEREVLENNLDTLHRAGFYLESKGNDFILKTTPLCCVGLNAQSFISDFLRANNDTKLLPDELNSVLMQTACKSAIKGEDDLTQSEINVLVEQIFSQISELFCPHGRPIAVKLSRKEIEKWFKRIV